MKKLFGKKGIIELPVIVFLGVVSLCLGYTAITGKGKPEFNGKSPDQTYCKHLVC